MYDILLISRQILLFFTAAAVILALTAKALDNYQRIFAVSLSFILLTIGFAPILAAPADLSKYIFCTLSLYVIFAVLPGFPFIRERLSWEYYLKLILAAGAILLILINQFSELFHTLIIPPYLIMIPAVLTVTVIFLNKKTSYHTKNLYLLLPLSALLLRYPGMHPLSPLAADAAIIIFSWLCIRFILQENNTHYDTLQAELDLLQNEFKEQLEKGVRARTEYLEQVKDRIAESNKYDPLTKALTRNVITRELNDMIHSKYIDKFVLLLFDIDYFKTINDSMGHQAGDECLKTLVTIAMTRVRSNDYIGRYGGDEFMILLPGIGMREGMIIAERFRKGIDQTAGPHFTVSIGAAAYPFDGENYQDLIEVADKGLYHAKENGRNQISYTGYVKFELI